MRSGKPALALLVRAALEHLPLVLGDLFIRTLLVSSYRRRQSCNSARAAIRPGVPRMPPDGFVPAPDT